MSEIGLKIGDLAQVTGLTVRTLRYYDGLELLTPSDRTAAGHRRYGAPDVERLYRIQALRKLGFRLREIADILGHRDDRPLTEVVAEQLAQVRSRIAAERRLEQRLSALQRALWQHEKPSNNDLLSLIGSMTMLDQQLRHDYAQQADRYDYSRGASPSVLAPLRTALAGSPGRDLLDIGGGTGNYAAALKAEGWTVTVVDVSEQMRQQAAAKGLRVL